MPDNAEFIFGDKNKVNHIEHRNINGRKNNHYENLEWVNTKGNYVHALQNNLIKLGDNLKYATLTNQNVEKICQLLEEGKSYDDIIEKVGLENNQKNKAKLISIKRREHWKHISCKYNWSKDKKNKKFDDDLIERICQFLDLGCSYSQIAKILSISNEQIELFRKLVWFIRKRITHKHISDKYKWWRK